MSDSPSDRFKEDLKKTLDEAEWVWLARHSERDAIILVSPSLDLLEVGMAMAKDDTAAVSAWIVSGTLSKPTREQLDAWNAEPTRRFLSLVVQPYVLIQGLAH